MELDASYPWWRKDASVIAALVAGVAIAFTLTFFYTRSFQRRQDSLSRYWSRTGQADLNSGNPKKAINDLRNALLYSPDNPSFRLRLAQALAADGQTSQSIAYFLNLWEEQPGNGLYNLELARLYASNKDARRAAQHYNAAIYGAWTEDPAADRRRARQEYIDFLLANKSQTQAQAEAITMAAAVPPHDVGVRFLAADTLLKTGEYERAMDEYRSLLGTDAGRAAAGAGNAAFRLGRFRSAARYYQIALDRGPTEAEASSHLSAAKQVLAADPQQRRLSSKERARRVVAAFETAGDRLQSCALAKHESLVLVAPITELQKLYEEWSVEKPDATIRKLSRDQDDRESVMDLVYRIEEATARNCGQPTGDDWALLMLARYGEGVQQ